MYFEVAIYKMYITINQFIKKYDKLSIVQNAQSFEQYYSILLKLMIELEKIFHEVHADRHEIYRDHDEFEQHSAFCKGVFYDIYIHYIYDELDTSLALYSSAKDDGDASIDINYYSTFYDLLSIETPYFHAYLFYEINNYLNDINNFLINIADNIFTNALVLINHGILFNQNIDKKSLKILENKILSTTNNKDKLYNVLKIIELLISCS